MKDEMATPVSLQGFLENFSVSSIILLLYRVKKTGILRFTFGGPVKTIYLKEGNIVFATSNLKDDRLGESLVRNGKITEEQMNSAAKEISPSKKLGKILVERGYITAKELFLGVRKQFEEIVLSLFSYPSGMFEFTEVDFTDEPANIPLNTRNLVLKGMRVGKGEFDLLKYFPTPEITIETAGDLSDLEFDEAETRIIAAVRARKTIKEIIESGDYATIGALGRLLEVNAIVRGRRFRREGFQLTEATSELLQNLNSIIMDIYSIIKSKSSSGDVRGMLNTFFLNPSPHFREVFRDIELKPDGSIDTNKLLRNVSSIKDGGPELLDRALKELLHFELFELKHYLKKEEEQELMNLVRELGLER